MNASKKGRTGQLMLLKKNIYKKFSDQITSIWKLWLEELASVCGLDEHMYTHNDDEKEQEEDEEKEEQEEKEKQEEEAGVACL